VRPTLGKEPAAEEANPVGYLSGDTGIGLATFSYKLSRTSCLQTPRWLTIICLICPATAPVELCPAASRRLCPSSELANGLRHWYDSFCGFLSMWGGIVSVLDAVEAFRKSALFRKQVSISRDGEDFVVAYQPDNLIVFGTPPGPDRTALRRASRAWQRLG
jgi:hypothetical protein